VAKTLEEEEELSVEIVVLGLLSPLPRRTIGAHLASRARLAVVEEAHGDFGIGAEIIASLVEHGFSGRAARISTPPVPIPSARSLEAAVIPGRDEIRKRILDLFE
jgi:pyruvate/2-oxoglutarate/acetoin dehydrogenase E1 component